MAAPTITLEARILFPGFRFLLRFALSNPGFELPLALAESFELIVSRHLAPPFL
jgi:hypothetical protein